jgi:hypothetical protein
VGSHLQDKCRRDVSPSKAAVPHMEPSSSIINTTSIQSDKHTYSRTSASFQLWAFTADSLTG